MKRIALALVIVFLAGCGAAVEGGLPASSGQETLPAATAPQIPDSKTQPPKILMISAAGKEFAVPGSSCVSYTDPATGAGVSGCGDSAAMPPEQLAVLPRASNVALLFLDAQVVHPDGCVSEDEQGCIGYVYVRPLGCFHREVERIPLERGPDTHWQLDLDVGAYQLDVFANFAAEDGRTGDVSGTLGLLVDDRAKPAVVPVDPKLAVCPFHG